MADVVHDTFVLERSYPAAPPKVFAAFSDPVKKRRWYAESASHDVVSYELDFRLDGIERSVTRFREGTPFPGVVMTAQAIYLAITPGERIVMAQTMAMGDHRFSAALITLEFAADGAGTKVTFTHQAAFFERSDGPAMRKDGWEKLLAQLGGELEAA